MPPRTHDRKSGQSRASPNLKALRKAKVYLKGDERILGDSEFVESVLTAANEALEKRYRLKAQGLDLDKLAAYIAELLEIEVDEVWASGKYRRIVNARSLLCFWAVRELGVSLSDLARRLHISGAAVSQSVLRGEKLAKQ
jgi:chromosomal replication initiation ATPase DnaA